MLVSLKVSTTPTRRHQQPASSGQLLIYKDLLRVRRRFSFDRAQRSLGRSPAPPQTRQCAPCFWLSLSQLIAPTKMKLWPLLSLWLSCFTFDLARSVPIVFLSDLSVNIPRYYGSQQQQCSRAYFWAEVPKKCVREICIDYRSELPELLGVRPPKSPPSPTYYNTYYGSQFAEPVLPAVNNFAPDSAVYEPDDKAMVFNVWLDTKRKKKRISVITPRFNYPCKYGAFPFEKIFFLFHL